MHRKLLLLFICASSFAHGQDLGDESGSMPPSTMAERPETRCVVQASEFHQVNPWVLKAILKVESGFKPGAINRNANGTVDVGMGQMNSIHFRELARYGIAPNDLMDACVATYVTAWHLSKQLKRHGNTWFGIATYHSAASCFNQRYQGLLWNQLVRWNVVEGGLIKTKSLAQCGYVAPGRQAKSGSVQQGTRQALQTQSSVLAFDN